nr:MAG TPA: hypothetical protein [Bacteriophage sp.]
MSIRTCTARPCCTAFPSSVASSTILMHTATSPIAITALSTSTRFIVKISLQNKSRRAFSAPPGQRFNIRRSGASLGRLQRMMHGRFYHRPCCCG